MSDIKGSELQRWHALLLLLWRRLPTSYSHINSVSRSSRHHYSQYLAAHVTDGDGRLIKSTKSSFYHFLCRLEWVPAYRRLESGEQKMKHLCPNSVYLNLPEISELLGTHVDYLDMDPSEFSRALGANASTHRYWSDLILSL